MDYKKGKTYKSSTEARESQVAQAKIDIAWWAQEDPFERADAMCRHGALLASNAETRIQANTRHARLYENVDLSLLSGGGFAEDVVREALTRSGMVSHNVVSMGIDTLQAKIAKNRPKPTFLTKGGYWAEQQKAKNLDKFTVGLFNETEIYRKAPQIFRDAGVWGTGILQVFMNDDGRLDCERVSIEEIFVDDLDGAAGKPRQIMRRRRVQREVLAGEFPEYEAEIMAVSNDSLVQTSYPLTSTRTTSDMIEVWEGWHLPVKGKNGKHCIAIKGCELECEDWKIKRHPFAIFRFTDRLQGFWGKGIAEALTGIQLEINRTVRSISEQMRRKGKGRTWVPMGSKVNPAHLTNGIGDIVFYTGGVPPTVDNSNALAQEDLMILDYWKQSAMQVIGVSELSAAAKKPSGLDAAVALREYSDIESERFAIIHQQWEQFFIDYASLSIELIADQYGARGYTVKTPSKRDIIEVSWKDINLDRDSYVMQVFPTSSLPQTPAARRQEVTEWMQNGFVDRAEARRLLNFPDIEAENNLADAALEDVDATIDAILYNKTPELQPIEPYQNLNLLMARAQAAYLRAKRHNAGEDRLSMLRQLIDSAATAQIPSQATPEVQTSAMMPPMGGPMPAPPPGAPMPLGPMIPPPSPTDMGVPQQ